MHHFQPKVVLRLFGFCSAVCLVLLSLFLGQVRAQNTLGLSPRFELIYVAPGDSTYSLFGHVALRVQEGKKDQVFDLGITDEIGLGGLSKVAMGQAFFHGEARSFPRMVKSWRRRDRSVIAYPLQLDLAARFQLKRELQSRIKGQSEPYLYDPLRANCSTQIRDAIDTITEGALTRAMNGVKRSQGRSQVPINSVRLDTRDGYGKTLGILVAIEFFVGHSLDEEQSIWKASYRPKKIGRAHV